jgi:hypothetical protein
MLTTGTVCLVVVVNGWMPSRADAQVAQVTFIQGVVEHLPAGQTRYVASTVGLSLGEGFRVRTGKRSRAEIRFANRNVVSLSQLSECIIHNVRDMDLAKGKLRGEYSSAARVRSGSTVANITGTVITIEVIDNDDGTVTAVINYLEADPTKKPEDQGLEILTDDGRVVLQPGRSLRFRGPRPRIARLIEEIVRDAPNVRLPDDRFRLGNAPPERFVDHFIDHALAGENIEGGNIRNIVGTKAQEILRSNPLQRQQDSTFNNLTQPEALALAQILRLPIAQPPQPPGGGGTGGVGVIVTSPVGPRHPRWRLPIKRAATPTSPEGLRGAPNYFAPRFDGSLFLFKGEGRDRSISAFLREQGVIGGAYWELAVTPSNFYDPARGSTDSDLDVTDANVVIKNKKWGSVTVGRQRFLKGPVQNTITGTLIRQGGRDIQDAITFSPKFSNKRVSLDLSYIVDAFPAGLPTAVSGTQPGGYGRLQYQTNFGTFALNGSRNSLGTKTGVTGDFSLPVVKNQVDFYGEIGKDTFNRDIRTFGVYFPGIFEKSNVDVFIEYTRLKDFGMTNEWLLRIYPRINDRMSAIIAIDKASGGDTTFGVGLAIGLGKGKR